MTGPGNMRHDIEGIRRAGKRIGNAGTDLEGVLSTLGAALDSAGECWGGDEAGQNFAKDYAPSADSCRSALQSLVDALGGIDDNLQQTAADSEQRDQQQARELGNLSG